MKKLFQLLNQMVRDGELSNYAVGGAIAAVFYIEPFATKDVDVFVVMETEQTGLVTTIPGWDYLKERGYTEVRGEAIVVEDWPLQFLPVLFRRKEAQRKVEAKRPVSEKMAAVTRLRDFVRQLEGVRKANRAKRAAKQIHIKSRLVSSHQKPSHR